MAPTIIEGPSQLPIRILNRSLVKASDCSIKPHVSSFNNLDIAYSCQVYMACLYPRHPKMRDFDDVIMTFKTCLPTLLNHFYPLAGRIITNPNSSLPELHYNNQGAELVVAEIDVSLGDLDYHKGADFLQKIRLPFPLDVPLSVQLMSFSDGAFSVVWGNNHLLNDGYSITMVIRMWSEVAQSRKVPVGVPNFDRSVFRARNPPLYSSEVESMYAPYDKHKHANMKTNQDSLVDRLYYIKASDIAKLREMASTEGQRASRAQALSAYVWKALAAFMVVSQAPEEHCRMGWWVNGRQRLTAPELVAGMANYFGNVVTHKLKKATVEEIQQKPLPDVAAMVRETIAEVDYDAYIQEHIDLFEQHKMEPMVDTAMVGLGPPTISLTMLTSFPLDTDFGFGQAALAMPIFAYNVIYNGFMAISPSPGADDGSWLVTARVWPRLAEALESDVQSIFKPLTAEYLGL